MIITSAPSNLRLKRLRTAFCRRYGHVRADYVHRDMYPGQRCRVCHTSWVEVDLFDPAPYLARRSTR